ncbi:MAG TPA: hypothetical protein VGM78_02000 [Ilumatobacteraceae bacterium]|jgi:hypothetical protein
MPRITPNLWIDTEKRVARAMRAMFTMKKLDIAALRAAADAE